MEAAGFEPASANVLPKRLYERRFRFRFAYLDGPGRRREASPLSVPYESRARARKVSPLNETGVPSRGLPGPIGAALLGGHQFTLVGMYYGAGVLRVSSKLGSSRWTLTAHVEAGTPPDNM